VSLLDIDPAILCATEEMPDFCRSSPRFCDEAAQCVENEWAALLFNSSYF